MTRPARSLGTTLLALSLLVTALGWLAVRPHPVLAPLRSVAVELDEPWDDQGASRVR